MTVNRAALAALYAMSSAAQYLMDASRGGYRQELADITVDIASVRALCECGANNPCELFRDRKIYARLSDFEGHATPRLRGIVRAMRETMVDFGLQ